MSSPATSGYPGTPFLLFVAGVAVFLMGKAAWLAHQARRDTTGRRDWRSYALRGVAAAFVLGVAIWTIWAHR